MRRPRSRRPIAPAELDLEPLGDTTRWCVYLFALTDCSAFKVGFSCNPLQRICSFSQRYFERFDLYDSLLFHVADGDAARHVESDLKLLLAPYRAEAPAWVPLEAGGHTEWFSAVHFGDARARLRDLARGDEARFAIAFDTFATDLKRTRTAFESWAVAQVARAAETQEWLHRGYAVRDRPTSLRDW